MLHLPKSAYHTGPVTSLCCVNSHVIAGTGCSLYVYSPEQRCCKHQCQKVLPHTTVHGIRPNREGSPNQGPSLLCVFGGKCVRVVSYVSETIQCSGQVFTLPDWIWDVAWVYRGTEEDSLVAVTAHNVVHRLDLENGSTIQSVACAENSILYCAKFIGCVWKNLLVASGTVFNQVLLWSPAGDKDGDNKALVMHRLVGHEGVIFSVEFCPVRRWICSVSDDRSVRVWQLKFPDAGDEVISLDQWKCCSSEQIHILYGHSARVWDVKILPSNLISVGEDSTCCVWDDQGKITHKFKGHKGKSIWSLAADSAGKYVVTGGGDNSIRIWKLDNLQPRDCSSFTCTTLSVPITQADFPRVVTTLNWNEVLILTNEGVLQLYNLATCHWRTLMCDSAFRSYTTIAVCPYQASLVALGNISGTLRIFCGNTGSERSVQDADWLHFDWQVHDGKVFSLNWLPCCRLLTTGPDGQMRYWELRITDSIVTLEMECSFVLPLCRHRWVSTAGIIEESEKQLLVCGDRGGTVHLYQPCNQGQDMTPLQSFPKIHGKTGVTDVKCHGNSIYTAGRDGYYNQYELQGDQLSLLHKNKVHKGFDWLDRLDMNRDDGDTLIYGFHSNSFVLWSVHSNQELVHIPCGGGHRAWDCQVLDNTIRFVYIKAGEVVFCNTQLWSNQVLLKNCLHGREITDAQHLVTFMTGSYPVEVIATCSEDTRINLVCVAPNQCGIKEMTVLQTLQGHISSVRTLAHCDSGLLWKQNGGCKKLIFSGGGRAQLMVWRISISESSSPDRVTGHAGLDLNCSFESLLNYRMEHWNRKHKKPWKTRSTKPNPETRFMDLAVVPVWEVWMTAPPGVYCVVAACSDGYVRFYQFCERERTLTLLEQALHHHHCVLKVDIMQFKSQHKLIALSAGTDGCIAFWDITKFYQSSCGTTNEDNLINTCNIACNNENKINEASGTLLENQLLTENSDKNNTKSVQSKSDKISESKLPYSDKNTEEQIVVADNENLCPVFVMSSHQSGVNSLHSLHIEGTDQFVIASGGDDNAINISQVTIATGPSGVQVTQDKTGHEPYTHAAQITGVHMVDRDQLISASVDQRVCMWNIVKTFQGIQLQQKWCRFVDVADLSTLCVWNTDRLNILTAGVGLEILASQTAEEEDVNNSI